MHSQSIQSVSSQDLAGHDIANQGISGEQGSPHCDGADVEITLVVPVYNEEQNIVPFVREVKAMVRLPHRIAIVFDHDDDTTLNKKDEILGAVRKVVGIRRGAISDNMRVSFQAA
ncbi:MAG: hypothetical protein K2Z80_28895, partial [Xanthobacteraceae bacterium]|nr:hypothetical protein [Xanthobacteraceae bacterium]